MCGDDLFLWFMFLMGCVCASGIGSFIGMMLMVDAIRREQLEDE